MSKSTSFDTKLANFDAIKHKSYIKILSDLTCTCEILLSSTTVPVCALIYLSQSALGFAMFFLEILNSRVSVLTANRFVMRWSEMHNCITGWMIVSITGRCLRCVRFFIYILGIIILWPLISWINGNEIRCFSGFIKWIQPSQKVKHIFNLIFHLRYIFRPSTTSFCFL